MSATPRDPHAAKLGAREVRFDMSFSLIRAPWTRGEMGDFVPDRGKVSWWTGRKARGCIVLLGRQVDGYQRFPYSATFNLYGYTRRRPCPDWLVPIIREAGYTGWITAASERSDDPTKARCPRCGRMVHKRIGPGLDGMLYDHERFNGCTNVVLDLEEKS